MLRRLAPHHPCPWCAAPMPVPPAMPEASLARALETRCASCHGGVQARAPWRHVLVFTAVYACASQLALASGARAWSDWRDHAPAGSDWLPYAWAPSLALAALAVVALLAQRYLVAATSLARGRPPRRG